MATYNDGPLGGFSGKLGPVVGSTWRDLKILRSLPIKSEKPPSEAQLLQRLKMAVTMEFLTPIRPLLKVTFKKNLHDKSGFETAKSYYMKETLQATESGWEILYSKVLISAGDLRGFTNPSISVGADHTLHLEWTDDSGQAMANASDKVLLVMFIPQLKQFEIFKTDATRADGTTNIDYPQYYQGVEAHCWATFGTNNGSRYAVSTYLGVVGL